MDDTAPEVLVAVPGRTAQYAGVRHGARRELVGWVWVDHDGGAGLHVTDRMPATVQRELAWLVAGISRESASRQRARDLLGSHPSVDARWADSPPSGVDA